MTSVNNSFGKWFLTRGAKRPMWRAPGNGEARSVQAACAREAIYFGQLCQGKTPMLTTKERNRATTASSRDSASYRLDRVLWARGRGGPRSLRRRPNASRRAKAGYGRILRPCAACADPWRAVPWWTENRASGMRAGRDQRLRDARTPRPGGAARGRTQSGDASLMTTLIIGAVVGAADLLQYGRPDRGNLDSDAEFPPLLLLDLLSTKRCS